MRKYELVSLFEIEDEPRISDEQLGHLEKLISDAGASVKSTHHWGRRKLAYPIDKKTDAYYTLHKLDAAPRSIAQLNETLRLEQGLIRYLLVLDEGGVGPEIKLESVKDSDEVVDNQDEEYVVDTQKDESSNE